MQRSMKDIVNAEPKSHGRDPEQYRFYEAFVKISQFWSIFWKLQDHRHGSRGRGCKCWVPCTQSHDKVAYLLILILVLWSLGLFNSFKDLRLWQWQVIHVFFGPCKFINVFVVKLNKHLHCILWLCNKRIWMSAFKWVQLGINKDGKTPH